MICGNYVRAIRIRYVHLNDKVVSLNSGMSLQSHYSWAVNLISWHTYSLAVRRPNSTSCSLMAHYMLSVWRTFLYSGFIILAKIISKMHCKIKKRKRISEDKLMTSSWQVVVHATISAFISLPYVTFCHLGTSNMLHTLNVNCCSVLSFSFQLRNQRQTKTKDHRPRNTALCAETKCPGITMGCSLVKAAR